MKQDETMDHAITMGYYTFYYSNTDEYDINHHHKMGFLIILKIHSKNISHIAYSKRIIIFQLTG